MHLRCAALTLWIGVAMAAAQPPRLVRVFPLGGQTGTTVSVEILGERLSNVSAVAFDSQDIVWKAISFASPHRLVGEVAIAPSAALGLHSVRVLTLDGPSNSGLFHVGGLPTLLEAEPNDKLERAVPVSSFPVDIHGRLDKAPDIDVFAFAAKSGERLVFDLKSIEDGSAVEARMILLDSTGNQIDFNDDRDDYNENPRIEHTFAKTGKYFLKLDQYRGPRGFNFGKLSAYILRIGSLPIVVSAQPRALERGSLQSIRLQGSGLDSVRRVYLTEVRQAEYSRMTYPYTIPVQFRADPPSGADVARIAGELKHHSAGTIDVTFVAPSSARPGLWRVWVSGPEGAVDAGAVEVTDLPVLGEDSAKSRPLDAARLAVAGSLDRAGERDQYTIKVRAGEPLQFWTVAEQIGVAHLDSVITLRDESGRRLAENDDVVAGQGTLLGNPDSRVFFTPEHDGLLTLEVRDRTGRGGPGYEYCLRADSRIPGFQLFTTPENFTIAQGETAELKVHLVREAGFKGEVDVWMDGLPDGVTTAPARFRADQLFEPNADGADMIIPELALRIAAPAAIAPGEYKIRVLGSPVAEANSPHRRIVEAHSTLTLGPLLDAWNFVRRPLPVITMTVVAPFPGKLTSKTRRVQMEQGKSADVEFEASSIPTDAPLRLLDLPAGVKYTVKGREDKKVVVTLDADQQTATGSYEFSAEAEVGSRRVGAGPITLSIREVADPGSDTSRAK